MTIKGEFVVVLIKPDAPDRGLIMEIFAELRKTGLNVNEIGTIQFNPELLKAFYQWTTIDHPQEMSEYMCSTPLPVLIAVGGGAVGKAMSVKARLRSRYATERLKNLFHCSSSLDDALKEYHLVMKNIVHKPSPGRTPNQVEAIVFKVPENGNVLFLMLKRAPERGGFWQPVTGNVERNESFENAAIREVYEELGIEKILDLIDTGYSYEFRENDLDQFERVFGVKVPEDTPVKLSSEHTEYQWVSGEDAIDRYLKYPGNKEGLRRLQRFIAEAEGV